MSSKIDLLYVLEANLMLSDGDLAKFTMNTFAF